MSRLGVQENVEELLIEEEMKDAYLTYAMSVIVSRALPDARDGLKPSQRRILVAMNDLSLGPRSHYRKCAKITGDTSGNYHPHGSDVVYPTLVRMAQPWAERYPLVDGQGNYGSIDGDPPAAMRYTEARMSALAVEMLEDLDKDTVDFQPNYDETREEPTVLPARFPNLLANGSSGIAVGMATSIPPHNLRELCDAIIAIIDKPDIPVKDLMKIVQGPDFPTGGLICGRQGIVDGYTTGRGAITVRGRAHTETSRGGKANIVVTEIPYGTIKTRIIERIADCVKAGTLEGIADIRDESDREGMRLVIELKRGEDEHVVLNKLYRHTPLQSSFSIINIALDKGRPKTMDLKQILVAYKNHRIEVIRRRTVYLLKKARTREHIVFGLLYAVANIDEVIEIIKKSPDVPTARERLMKKAWRFRLTLLAGKKTDKANQMLLEATKEEIHLTGAQTDAILSMRLQQLTGLEVEKLRDEWVEVRERIAEYEAILRQDRLVLNIIAEDLYEIKEKYGDARRTEIAGEVGEFQMEDLIAEENCVVTISHEGYIKRMPLTSYRRQGRGGKGIIGSTAKEGDFIEHMFVASTHDYILFFSNRGHCYWQRVYDIPQMSRQSKGRAIINLLQMHTGESIASFIPVREFDEKRQLVFATAHGTVKKTALAAFSHPRKGGIIAMGLDPDDTLIDVALSSGSDEIVLATRDGMAIRYKETDVRSMGRSARGVRGVGLKKKGDEVVGMTIVDKSATLLTVCENGHGKRTEFSEYRTQRRGGKGLINIRTTDRNGKVVAMMTVRDGDELMLITQQGQIMRIGVDPKSMRPIGRATQGIRIIRLEEGDKLVAVARVAPEEAEDAPGEAPPATPEEAE
ncbi:MAG: DNA gyrase subunit A [Phycisphaerae bacterium]|nr:DNA gyrase subunit A [Phycisphaerae bacterium]